MEDVVVKSSTLLLGIEGEKNIVRYKFPIDQWVSTYGSGGEFALMHQRPTDTSAHLCAITQDSEYVYWIPAQAEMQYSGKGQLEFQYTVGTALKKSQIFETIINVSLDGSGNPPQAWSGWAEQVAAYMDNSKMWAVGTTDTTKEQYNNSAKDWANKAETSATHYPYINSTNKHWMVWDATTSSYVDTGVVAEGTSIQSDWNQTDTTQPDYIKNKPSIPSLTDYYTKEETDELVDEVADDLTTHETNTNVHTNATEKATWNAKYTKPTNGIPSTDMSSAVQTSLGKADTALQEHQSLANYSLISETGNKIDLALDETDYKLTATLYDKNNNLISTSTVIDLPIEQLVVNVQYDSTTKELVITLKNGTVTRVPLSAIVSGLATETWVTNNFATQASVATAIADAHTHSNMSVLSAISNSDFVFCATYGTTTASEIATAITNGKTIFCKYTYGGVTHQLMLVDESNSEYGFAETTVGTIDDVTSVAGITIALSKEDSVWEVLTGSSSIPTKTSDLTNDSGFLTQHQDISGKENTSNKVTSISSASTDTQYPSAKCVYDIVGNVESLLGALL